MNKANLLRLADILDEAQKVYEKAGIKQNFIKGYYQGHFVHMCGAPACAIGHWAANTPTWSIDAKNELIERDDPALRELPFFGAGLDFELNSVQLSVLFEGGGCGRAKTAKEAADYIRDFVARDGVLTSSEIAMWS